MLKINLLFKKIKDQFSASHIRIIVIINSGSIWKDTTTNTRTFKSVNFVKVMIDFLSLTKKSCIILVLR